MGDATVECLRLRAALEAAKQRAADLEGCLREALDGQWLADDSYAEELTRSTVALELVVACERAVETWLDGDDDGDNHPVRQAGPAALLGHVVWRDGKPEYRVRRAEWFDRACTLLGVAHG